MAINVSKLKVEDIDRLIPILRQHIRDRNTGEVIETEITDCVRYMKGRPDSYGRVRHYFVAKDEAGRPLGCMAYTDPDSDMLHHFSEISPSNSAELVNVFVDENYHHQGVGRQLLTVICDQCQQLNKKYLVINSGPRYKKSWGFYDHTFDENWGFIIGKFGPGGDANTWLKKL